MNRTLNILIIILGLIVAIVLIAAISLTTFTITRTSDTAVLWQKLTLLPSIAISSGVLVAILTFARERRKLENERQRHLSEVMLKRASDGFHNAIFLLSDRNNNRTTWVRAARTLLKSVELKEQIKSPEYLLAYQLEEEKARNELYSILTIEDENKERMSLPPQFFYGIEDWADCKTLDEAAIKASQEVKVYSPSIDKNPPHSSLKQLSTHSVVAIYDFMEYPEDYKDPLKSVVTWGEDWESCKIIDQGARRYVAHAKQKHAVGGKIIDLKKSSDDKQ